eukprot:TRINITY_DN102_c1_g1_i1.p1 TRINITY_DN102_c1_g1~~TRINITY_DN102_c1_g1_i1.p1  ORF type:complete len:313 (+),score=0.58 TRINITY_DN102_c1_g1_i1:77-940(+)
MMNNHRVPAEGQNGRMERDQEEPQETIRKLTIENTQLNSRIEDIAMENVHLNRRIEELVMDNAMIGTISEETKRELGETKRELREAKRELGETKNELEATKGELREMKVRYEEQKSMNHEGINDIKRSLNAINDTLVTILEVLRGRKLHCDKIRKTKFDWTNIKQTLLCLCLYIKNTTDYSGQYSIIRPSQAISAFAYDYPESTKPRLQLPSITAITATFSPVLLLKEASMSPIIQQCIPQCFHYKTIVCMEPQKKPWLLPSPPLNATFRLLHLHQTGVFCQMARLS